MIWIELVKDLTWLVVGIIIIIILFMLWLDMLRGKF